ncbi:MAG: protein kinase [Rhabdochlamydiaceae bacterium]|nr:protein kinase [Candidatus Amphrikana amoebophyrae]
MESIGVYKLQKLIARGGMGEVFLAHDPNCERVVALKRIREEYLKYESMRKRFLKEAKIAAQLSHPSIIPIHFIHQESDEVYYTMPFVEGDTLKDILKNTIDAIKSGDSPHPIGSSIPSLIRLFLSVCQAVSFSHSNHILHRDLKPGNIMVGKFGQVVILDWGLAQYLLDGIDEDEDVEIPASIPVDITRPGKAVGTLTYMAPERAFNHPASVKSDIYALGIILYQILTLKTPFKRNCLKEFRAQAKYEKLRNPIEVAPERDIPMQLGQIAKKCLAFHPDDRFHDMSELIYALENYIEGKPEWIFQNELSIQKRSLWEFQENILLNRNIAIMRSSEMMEWVMLMISKSAYTGNFRIEADITTNYGSKGVALLFCMPQADAKKELEEGFCLWLGTKKEPGVRLYRSNIEVFNISDISLKADKTYHVTVEKVESKVSLHINNRLVFNFITYIPVVGSYIGLVCKDMDFTIENWKVYVGSQSAMINCLSIPDAFLAEKDFDKALKEYARISQSFRGRIEGREAIFRTGITLIEKAKTSHKESDKTTLLLLANDEFEKLEKTSAAPFEYLGKSMIYHFEGDVEEEVKCLELALRKYPKHPLIHIVQEQVIFRMHESAKENRKKTYLFALLALHLFPKSLTSKETLSLFRGLEKNIEPLPLFQKPSRYKNEKERFCFLTMQLCFWLEKPRTILELVHNHLEKIPSRELFLSNALFSLLFMREKKLLQSLLSWVEKTPLFDSPKIHYLVKLLHISQKTETHPMIDVINEFSEYLITPIGKDEIIILYHFYYIAMEKGDTETFNLIIHPLTELKIDPKHEEFAHILLSKLYLLSLEIDSALELFEKHPSEITHPLSHFYSLYTTASIATGGKKRILEAISHLIELPHPPITAMLAHFLAGHIVPKEKWIEKSFPVEQRSLYEQLYIYYKALRKNSKAESMRKALTHCWSI